MLVRDLLASELTIVLPQQCVSESTVCVGLHPRVKRQLKQRHTAWRAEIAITTPAGSS